MVPSNLTTCYPDDALIHHPFPPVQKVELPLEGERVHLTLTGIARVAGDTARGPAAGTVPRNKYGEGTESCTVAIANIGPHLQDLEQIAVFISTGSGMMRMSGSSHNQRIGGQYVDDMRPAYVDGRLGIVVDVDIVRMASLDSVQFQVTCTGFPAPEDGRTDDAAPNEHSSIDQSPFEPRSDRRTDDDPFGRERNDVFSDDDF